MKKLYTNLFLSILFVFTSGTAWSTVWTVTNSGFTFTPNIVTITEGDTVMFTIGNNHNVIEVSQQTWNANGSTSNGGFTLPFGGGMVIPTTTGTHYYVCQPHSSLGMKGQIVVNPATGIPDNAGSVNVLGLSPNPANYYTKIQTGLSDGETVSVNVFDLTGKSVLMLENVPSGKDLNVSTFKEGIYFSE